MFMNLKRAKIIAAGLAICFLCIHILMITIFYQCEVFPMVYFNIFSICFYLFALFMVYKEWLPTYAVTVYMEVAIHMTLAVLLTGWESGFQVTLIGMNVLAFYAEYTGRSLKLKYIRVMPFCILGMFLYLGSRVYLRYNPAQYALPEEAQFWLTILWGVIVFVINISVLQLLVYIANTSEEKQEYQLSHDKLTGLPNRYFFSSYLENLKSDNCSYWVAISDIDNFKKINDTYGHNCGDYVLKTIGGILDGKGVLCCRWGGEEFLFLDKISKKKYDPYEFLEQIRKEIEDIPFEFEGKRFRITMTFGMSTCTDTVCIEDVIRDADEKLYAGKHSGKNKVVVAKDVIPSAPLSYQDQLTRVKNKSAYDKMVESLEWDIGKGTAQFGVVRVVIEGLRDINEKYGNDKGNAYISGACKIICSVFVNSQVFRISGDEFVVILTNRDYYDRDALFTSLENKYTKASQDDSSPAWCRYRTDCSLAVYSKGDKNYGDVFARVK